MQLISLPDNMPLSRLWKPGILIAIMAIVGILGKEQYLGYLEAYLLVYLVLVAVVMVVAPVLTYIAVVEFMEEEGEHE